MKNIAADVQEVKDGISDHFIEDIHGYYHIDPEIYNILFNYFNIEYLTEFQTQLNSGTFNIPGSIESFVNTFSIEFWNHCVMMAGGNSDLLFTIMVA